MFAPLAALFFFVSWLLLLLVSLSVPITKTIYLLQVNAAASSSLLDSQAAASVRFGVWGYCTSGIDAEVFGFDHTVAGQCSHPKLGYTFDSSVAQALHVDSLADTISSTLSAALVLHVVDCILAFLALVSALLTIHWSPHVRAAFFTTLGAALLAAILTTVTFIIDLVVAAVARDKITDEVHVSRGNAIWMTVSAGVYSGAY
ncbi:actin cortical patch SUR7/pH-response regulator pali [Epithele typhae]|uniref:actin cortical patch SUR7/pH-response regulator pali n=1 Tax=Epithele typhae TaxID=378194 RepID=UPI0020080B7A|nr:actin cortical patch SUR7/pH-response regulator pali [Epithele typhae]KAH9945998.1 actin cortical patch SUR7/pH-response regulator pali [Epithele typhae]